jgi:hypothetical protein
MMSGPFSRLMDTNYSYSIQLEIYRYGRRWQEGENKTTYGCYPEGYELVHTIPMKIWVTTDGVLHAKYKHYKDKIYDPKTPSTWRTLTD